MFEWIADPSAWVALATLTMLEIVLGIDNIIFISILVGKLPPEQRQRGRIFGLAGAVGTLILFLISLVGVMRVSDIKFLGKNGGIEQLLQCAWRGWFRLPPGQRWCAPP